MTISYTPALDSSNACFCQGPAFSLTFPKTENFSQPLLKPTLWYQHQNLFVKNHGIVIIVKDHKSHMTTRKNAPKSCQFLG